MENIHCLEIKNYKDYKKLIEDIENLCLNERPLVVIPKLVSKIDEEEMTVNIANTLALKENKILIVDCNLKNINIYNEFNISNDFGLYEILEENIRAENIIINIDNNLDILTLGSKKLDLVNESIANKLKDVLVYLRSFYDYIVLDMPETFIEYAHILNEINRVILLGRSN